MTFRLRSVGGGGSHGKEACGGRKRRHEAQGGEDPACLQNGVAGTQRCGGHLSEDRQDSSSELWKPA